MKTLRLAHLYPDLMNLYGDRGNIIVLRRRCAWRGIELVVDDVSIGDDLAGDYDLAFIGGGQDREQLLVCRDFQRRLDQFKGMVDGGLVVLAICGGYQLLGRRFLTYQNEELPGLGILDIETVGGQKRLIGNVVVKVKLDGSERLLVGFENHSGRTILGPGARPLGTIERGFGNNGRDGTEGARQANVFGTYLHGSLLPKNPWFADYLLEPALKRKYGDDFSLEPLDDGLEDAARTAAIRRIEEIHRRRWVPGWFKR
ncbi:MAG: glutamine amidotransferase [Actinomycetota bacterium]|nr:glutamine amidotransferase [Actinomycetota bacterium]